MSKTVYVPVAVSIDDDGHATSAFIDYEGAPWMYVGREDVFNEDTGEWESSLIEDGNEDNMAAVDEAEGWIAEHISTKEAADG